jgi:hypothetical protein
MGMKRMRLGGLLVAGLSIASLMAPAAGSALSYSVRFQIQRGKYTSNYSCLPGCGDYGGIHRFAESDENVNIDTVYEGLKIPLKGRPNTNMVVRGKSDVGPVGNWSLIETYWTQDNPNAPVNCHGVLFETSPDPPEIFAGSGTTAQTLNLDVQSGSLFQPKTVAGTNCDQVNAEKWHAFYPATWETPGDGYIPDMLTARVSLPLGALRKLHVGDIWGETFHQGRAKRLPPASCTNFTGMGSCSQQLNWTGHLTVKRTG